MVVICPPCKEVQRGNVGDKCNALGCIGRLEEAFRCSQFKTVQRAGPKCIKAGCIGGELKRQKQSDQPRRVQPVSHVVLPTASEVKVFTAASQDSGDGAKSRAQVGTQLKTGSSQESGDRAKFRAQLEAQLKTGPSAAKKSPTREATPTDDAPKVIRSQIPVRTVTTRNLANDVQFVTTLMRSAELRKIVIVNMLPSYNPSEGAKRAKL